jgi:CTP:molybdopterin cytidylyltransferase MocA
VSGSGTTAQRQDLVLILARGDSRRMRSPKGLLPCPGHEPETFVGRIAACYDRLGMTCVVVTTPVLATAHAEAVAAVASCRVVARAPGGETGRTVWWGWRAASAATTHLWAHPVDMPLVLASTLQALLAASSTAPGRVVRPVCGGQPGHPVIMPTAVLARLLDPAAWQHETMAAVLGQGTARGEMKPSLLIPVADTGVVCDFDTPADLEP